MDKKILKISLIIIYHDCLKTTDQCAIILFNSTYSRGAYTNFLHEERKMRKLFFARRAYSTHFTRHVEKNKILLDSSNELHAPRLQ